MAAIAAGLLITAAGRLPAQGSRQVDPSPADLAIALGRLDVAEVALYDAVARTPREPSARGMLGSFLAARGKFLSGATLLDEALYFGADTASVQMRQMNLYRWTGDYARIAALSALRLPAAMRDAYARAGSAVAGGAISATVELRPNDGSGLGRISIEVGGVALAADVQPLADGLQLPSSIELFSAIEPTGARGDTTWGVARAISIGGVTYGPVPVALVPSLPAARIGLDILSRLAPTFDDKSRTLTVRAGRPVLTGTPYQILLGFPGVQFVAAAGSTPVFLHTPGGRAALRGVRWTLDVGNGVIVVER